MNEIQKNKNRIFQGKHIYAHLKEKKVIAQNMLELKTRALEDLEEACTEKKKLLYKVGLERIDIQERIRMITDTPTLMHRVNLQHDYDYTVDKIAEKRKYLAELKRKLEDLETKSMFLLSGSESSGDE